MAKTTKTSVAANDFMSLSINECASLIGAFGDKVTTLVQGDMGSGKTSLLKMLSARFPNHHAAYFDCTTKDIGDLYLPDIARVIHSNADHKADCVRFVPNEEFGLQYGKPVLLMLDEIGKNRAILNPLLRVMQEHSIGNNKLPPGSIVFATTNLGSENVGDSMPPHARNRICVVRMTKPSVDQWMNWGVENDIEPVLMAAVKELPQMLQSFTEVDDPKDNPYIYHPKDTQRTAFVTPRSLEKVSHLLKQRHALGDNVVQSAMCGLVGAKAALDLKTYIDIGDKLPAYEAIVKAPTKTAVPDESAACIISALMCAMRVEAADFKEVFTYVKRLPTETQALFVQQLLAGKKNTWAVEMKDLADYGRQMKWLFVREAAKS